MASSQRLLQLWSVTCEEPEEHSLKASLVLLWNRIFSVWPLPLLRTLLLLLLLLLLVLLLLGRYSSALEEDAPVVGEESEDAAASLQVPKAAKEKRENLEVFLKTAPPSGESRSSLLAEALCVPSPFAIMSQCVVDQT